MKNLYLFAAFSLFSFAHAQIPNRSFEELASDGVSIKNWGHFFPMPVTIDMETGTTTSDEVIFENGLGFSYLIGDCVTGSWAMNVTNAWNMTKSEVIPGKSSIFNDTESATATGWNNGIPLPENTIVQFLGFDYKFFPAGNDIAEATLEIFNADGASIGKASIDITAPTSEFQYVYAPIEVMANETPAFMTIEFSMAKEGSFPTFGSQLIVDNVVVNSAMLAVTTQRSKAFTAFPTAVSDVINIVKSDNEENGDYNLKIIDINGKVVRQDKIKFNGATVSIDVSNLLKGEYFVKIANSRQASLVRFLKK